MVLRVDDRVKCVRDLDLKVVRFSRKQLNRAEGFDLEPNVWSVSERIAQTDVCENNRQSCGAIHQRIKAQFWSLFDGP